PLSILDQTEPLSPLIRKLELVVLLWRKTRCLSEQGHPRLIERVRIFRRHQDFTKVLVDGVVVVDHQNASIVNRLVVLHAASASTKSNGSSSMKVAPRPSPALWACKAPPRLL